MTSKQRQQEARRLYDNTDYFSKHLGVFSNLNSPFQRYRIRKVLEIYRPAESDDALDLGCGWGTFTFALAPCVRLIVGLDSSYRAIAVCEKLAKIRSCSNAHFVHADAEKTGLGSEMFDVIVCADLVEHLYPSVFRRTLEECNRLLKQGGKLVIWTPNRGHVFEILKNNGILLKKDMSHVDYKSMNGLLAELREGGFSIKKAYYVESHIPILATIERALMNQLPFLRRRIAILAEKALSPDSRIPNT